MSLEIEHKFLVKNEGYKQMFKSYTDIRQGYLCKDPERTVRVRIRDGKGYLTVKGITSGDTRKEYEYEISLEDADEMLALCLHPLLEKRRYIVEYEGHIWEIDEFHGQKEGLVTAEIELTSPDTIYRTPPFVGENVTGNPAYYNSNL